MLADNHVVERSKALVWAQFQDYGVGELKILDTYLSRINARDPGSSRVTFTKKEYADLMGLDADIRTDQLKKYTARLLRNVVTVDLPNKGYKQYPLFTEAECEPDGKTGQVTITIDCNQKLKPAFFDIAQNGYVRYQLKNIISLNSQYSVRLYPKLKDRPHGWTVPVDHLREIMGATNKAYTEFKAFNRSCLKRAVDEINTITDITVEVGYIRKGKAISFIRFETKEKERIDSPAAGTGSEQLTLDEFENADYEEAYDPDDPLALAASMLPEEFTRDQVQLLRSLALEYVPYTVASFTEKEMWVADYLQAKVTLMKATRGVMSKFGWLKQAVAENWT